jgi:integrase/recombinase XerD
MSKPAAAVEDYLSHLKLERGLSDNTLGAYRRDLGQFCNQVSVSSTTGIQRRHLSEFVATLARQGLKPATISRKISCVRQFLQYLVRQGQLTEKSLGALRAPKIARYHPGALSVEEVARVIESVDPESRNGLRDRAILELLYGCGLRISELINLRWSDIEMEAGFVRVRGKGNKQRLTPLGDLARQALQRFDESRSGARSQSPLVFPNRKGKPFSRVNLWKLVKTAVLRAGIAKSVSPHTFRHSFATHMLAGGADLRVVQEMLGHADISTTQVYTKVDRDYLIAEHRKYHPRELAKGSCD